MAEQPKLDSFSQLASEENEDNYKGIYRLPEGWKWIELGNEVWINKEKRNPEIEIPEDEFIYIDISSIEGGTGQILEPQAIFGKNAPSRARRVIHTNDVIMSTVRPYLKSFAIIPEEYDNQMCSTGFAVLTSKGEVLAQYLFYILFSDLVIQQCNSMMTGAHYPALRMDQVSKIKIALPPPEEQKKIVVKVEELLSRIKEAEKIRKYSREETDSLMQSALHNIFSKAEKRGWEHNRLDGFCKINPSRIEIRDFSDDLEVTFVPMKTVNAITGRIEAPKRRSLGEVRKGYTYFKEGDVLFAKITPCMENGKSAIARNLINKIGFGSTEFHVIRPLRDTIPEWIYFFVRQKSFRKIAARNMTGTVGHQRVPKGFIEETKIPLPSLEEQKELVSYFSNLKEKSQILRQRHSETDIMLERITPAILDKAFKGKLV